jgi:transposase
MKCIGGIRRMSNILHDSVEIVPYTHGKASLIAGICKRLDVSTTVNRYLSKSSGRKPDISYGVMAEMMIANLCDSHKPLYLLDEYFEMVDIKGIFNIDASHEQLNDDRFGNFLDRFHEAGPRKIFSEISALALNTYGLSIRNVNYDTTSKVMWGEYETPENKVGTISIDFGHSKEKREDKKQIKMGIGTANGIIVDAKVLSGNVDDKTFNNEMLDDVNELLEKTSTDKDTFYYVADSAFFTEDNLIKAKRTQIKFITRVPETTNLAKDFIKRSLEERNFSKTVFFENAQGKKSEYYVLEYTGDYRGLPCKLAVCYSCSLEDIKQKTIIKQSIKEQAELAKALKQLAKRDFACEADAQKELEQFFKTKGKKLKYHFLEFNIEAQEKRKAGRPSKEDTPKQYIYKLTAIVTHEEEKVKEAMEEACTFVLASNDLGIPAEEMLLEYKTQSSVEKKFQQLKSPSFVNALYVKSPERVEALTYMLLITMMILSVVEYVVRRELKREGEIIIGPGKVKMKKPTLLSIISIFQNVVVFVLREEDQCKRILQKPLKESQLKVLRYLGLDESIFIGSVL